MKIVHTIAELRAFVSSWHRAGEKVSFVPTMGSLHAGHLSLVERAEQLADRIVVSIFVNPLQFAAGEDFECYPRELAADAEKLSAFPVDVVFAPSVKELYPHGRDGLTEVRVPGISSELCGEFRTGHFEGVTTVVSLLFHIVQPDFAVFGQKDYQQLAIIRRMVADQHMPVEVVGVPTMREAGGLAMSSRNQYLSAKQREQAQAIHRCLLDACAALTKGEQDFEFIERSARAAIDAAGLSTQFFSVRAADLSLPNQETSAFVVLAAATIGSTRLIDNMTASR